MKVNLVEAIASLNEKEVLAEVEKRLKSGEDPNNILAEAKNGVEIVGKKFEKGDYFLGELVYSGEILKEIAKLIKPKMEKTSKETQIGTVVMGSVAGDLHDIGKNIVIFLLETNGFKVYDLGVDVPAEKFVEKIKETGADIVGLSGLLTVAIDSMKNTIQTIKDSGSNKVRIMIGGAPIDEDAKEYTGADAWGRDAFEGVTIAKKWADAS